MGCPVVSRIGPYRVSRGEISLGFGSSNRGEQHPCWHTILLAKSSVLYLCRADGSRNCSTPRKVWLQLRHSGGKGCLLRGSISDRKRLADSASCTRLPAFCPLLSKGIQTPAAAAVLFLCAFSSLAGPTFEQIGFLADFHQPMFLVVGQFAVIDLVLLTEQHHQLFNLAALDL